MKKLKPNIIKLSEHELSDEEFKQIEKRFRETGSTGKTPMREIIEACKKNPGIILSYESETMPFDEYVERLQNGEFDE